MMVLWVLGGLYAYIQAGVVTKRAVDRIIRREGWYDDGILAATAGVFWPFVATWLCGKAIVMAPWKIAEVMTARKRRQLGARKRIHREVKQILHPEGWPGLAPRPKTPKNERFHG